MVKGSRGMSKHAKQAIRNIMSDGKERSLTVLFEDIAALQTKTHNSNSRRGQLVFENWFEMQ